jgi:hypothetical protein
MRESPGACAWPRRAGCWSPSRPGVVLLTDQAGGVEAWDLLDRSHTPVLRAAAASTALSAVSLAMVPLPGSGAAALQLLAVGDSAGTLRVLELPRNLRRTVGGPVCCVRLGASAEARHQ